ncbi:MAG: hypothetical protein ACXVZW_09320 [Gaiellaceae bacterium]
MIAKGTPFHGRPTLALDNGLLHLEALARTGPRIVRLLLHGVDKNLLAETPDASWKTPWGDYRLLGGHRLWCAPESPWSSVPEGDELIASELGDGLRLEQLEPETKLRKVIEVELAATAAEVRLRHVMRNEGDQPRLLAPWAITMVRLGGTAILPQQIGPLGDVPQLPNRRLVLWPYSSWSEPRLELSDELVTVRAEAGPPFKIGQLDSRGWIAYLLDDVLFCKRFGFETSREYPDLGCNAEVYCDTGALELESLAPIVELAPGEETVHEEVWQLRQLAADERAGGLRALATTLDLG